MFGKKLSDTSSETLGGKYTMAKETKQIKKPKKSIPLDENSMKMLPKEMLDKVKSMKPKIDKYFSYPKLATMNSLLKFKISTFDLIL